MKSPRYDMVLTGNGMEMRHAHNGDWCEASEVADEIDALVNENESLLRQVEELQEQIRKLEDSQ